MNEKTIHLTPLRDSLKKSVLLLMVFLGATFLWRGIAQVGPIEATGFNEDVVANGVGSMDSFITAIIDSDRFCLLSEDWKLDENSDPLIDLGLPNDGVIPSTITGLSYLIPSYEENNSLRIDNNGPSYSGDLTLSTPKSYIKLYFLVLSGNGDSDVNIDVKFTDDTVQNFDDLSVPDWYDDGLPVELSGFGRGDRSNNNVEYPLGNPKLFRLELDIDVINQIKLVKSITFTKTNTFDDSVLNVIAISGEENTNCLEPNFEITASDNEICAEEGEVILYVPEITPGTIYFQGTDPDGESTNNSDVEVTVNEPGTYYFRSYYTWQNEAGEEEECWGDSKSIIITQLEIEIDAGEDQFIGCGESVQLNASTSATSGESEIIYEANSTSDFQPWNVSYTTNSNPWNKNSQGNEAGGTTPEIKYTYKGSPSEDVNNWIRSPLINAENYNQDLELSFKHYLDHYVSYTTYPYNIIVEISFDNNNWSSVYNEAPTDDMPAQNQTINLNTSGEEQFHIRFRVSGLDWGMWYWYIDDIKITGSNNLGGASYSWSPEEGLDDPTILNPIASPSETTTYTLTVTVGGCEFTDEVEITVDNCLPVLEVCAKDVIIDLNQGLPEDVNPEDVVWYEGENGIPGSTEVSDPENVVPGIYWALYDDGEYWHLKVKFDFTGDCLDCVEIIWEEDYDHQTSTFQSFSPEEADYGVLDFYKIGGNGFKIRFDGANLNGSFFYFKPNNQFNVRFLDGSIWGEGGIEVIGNLTGESNKPILRLVFGPFGVEGFYGSKVSADDLDYELEPVELFNEVSFNTSITWYDPNRLPIKIESGQPLNYNFRSVNIAECRNFPQEVFINPHLRSRAEH